MASKTLNLPLALLTLYIAFGQPSSAFAIIKGVNNCDMAQHAEREALEAQQKAFDAKKSFSILKSLKSDAPEYAVSNAKKAVQQYESAVESNLAFYAELRKTMEQRGENSNCPDVVQP